MFAAALDTNTLWPSLRRDFLLSLAVEGMYRPVWSERTLEELEYCERVKLIDRGSDELAAAERSQYLISRMRDAFADAVVEEGLTSRVRPLGLPDENDEHVVAAAFVAGAQVIVTENLKDFPSALLPAGIDVIHPAAFARDTVSVDPSRALAATYAMAERRSSSPVEDILKLLESRYAMDEACALLREAI